MTIYLNMFGVFMKHMILSNILCRLTVTIKRHFHGMMDGQTKQETFQPFKLRNNNNYKTVLYFNRRMWNNMLFICFPRSGRLIQTHKQPFKERGLIWQLAQSKSHHRVKQRPLRELRKVPWPGLSHKYRTTRRVASLWNWWRDCINCSKMWTTTLERSDRATYK